jgi:hypothetical protein
MGERERKRERESTSEFVFCNIKLNYNAEDSMSDDLANIVEHVDGFS